jgi:apolipoprotein N-acyltransferase
MPAGERIANRKLTGPRIQDVALLVSLVVGAFVMALSLASRDHAWLGWLTLLPLFLAIRVQHPIHAMLSGGLWGSCLFLFGTTAFETGIAANAPSFALLAGAPAAYAFFGARLTRRIGFSPFVLGVSWMAVELALSTLGLHDGLLAGTQGDGTLMQWLGGALGYVLVAFVVAFINAILVAAISAACGAISSSRNIPGPAEGGAVLIPQTFCCFPLFAVPIAQPRAPPTCR